MVGGCSNIGFQWHSRLRWFLQTLRNHLNFCMMVHIKYPNYFIGVKAHFLQLSIFTFYLSHSWKSEILRKKDSAHQQQHSILCSATEQLVKFNYCPPIAPQCQDASLSQTLLRLFVGSSIQGRRFQICLGFSLSSANDCASWKCDIGMTSLEWFKPLPGVTRTMYGDLFKKKKKKKYSASSPSQNYYISQPHASLLMNSRNLVWSSLDSARPATVMWAASVALADACCQRGVLQQLLLWKHCLRSGPETAVRLSPSLNLFSASQQGTVQ